MATGAKSSTVAKVPENRTKITPTVSKLAASVLCPEDKAFLAARVVLRILEEHDASGPGITIFSDGSGFITLVEKDYFTLKDVAESLTDSRKWWNDLYGNYCLQCDFKKDL